MSLFSLPLANGQTSLLPVRDRSVRYQVRLPVRKRKRNSPNEEDLDPADDSSDAESHPIASTNPLSLTPAEIAQYKLAGLELDQELPSIQDFPHRGLRRKTEVVEENLQDKRSQAQDVNTFGTQKQEESDLEQEGDAQKVAKGHEGLRLQHFKVLVAMLHKCLQDGDIQRALRAWSILLRLQFKGEEIDIRSTGYWAIGAELLVRSETRSRPADLDEHEEEVVDESLAHRDGVGEWGTQNGRQRATEFLGKLILEYPPTPQYPTSTSAKDFWPSMLAIEIYGMDFEHKKVLREIAKRKAAQLQAIEDDINAEESTYGYSADALEERSIREKLEVEDQAWIERDQACQTTLAAAQGLVSRVDELLGSTTYASNLGMIEIRAHLTMYIADLVTAESPVEKVDLEDEFPRQHDIERKMVQQQRLRAYEQSLEDRKIELTKARTYVNRIVENGGTDEHFRRLFLEDD